MAIKKVYELAVDLKRTSVRVNIPVLVQGDSAEFRIRLLDNGAELSTEQLTGITKVSMQSGYDAQTVIQTVGTLQGSVAVFRLKKNELFRSGTVQAMVQLEDTEDRISTLRFQYQVIPDLAGNYIPGEQDITVFQRYMNEAQAKIDEMAATDVAQLTVKLAETSAEAKRKRGLNDLTAEALSAIEGGEGTNFNLLSEPRENSVSPSKTNFLNTGKNKFDPAQVSSVYRIDRNTGEEVESDTSKATEFIPVIAGETYTLKFYSSHVAFYDADKNFISGLSASTSPSTFATPENAVFVRFNVVDNQFKIQQLERGATSTDFEPYHIKSNTLSPALIDLNSGTLEFEYVDGKISKVFEKQSGVTVKTIILTRTNNTVSQVIEETTDFVSTENITISNGKVSSVTKTVAMK